MTNNPVLATHVVTSKLRRTLKLIAAMNVCEYVVTPLWVEACLRQSKLLPVKEEFLLKDPEGESVYCCSIQESLKVSVSIVREDARVLRYRFSLDLPTVPLLCVPQPIIPLFLYVPSSSFPAPFLPHLPPLPLQRKRTKSLFRGLTFWVSQSVVPERRCIRLLIEGAGGVVDDKRPSATKIAQACNAAIKVRNIPSFHLIYSHPFNHQMCSFTR